MTMTLPILFNNRHILPSGRLPLRVAPGTQLTTVKYAMRNGLDIGVCMDETSPIGAGIGTRVSIEDFSLSSEDGSLTITVSGHESFIIDSVLDNDENIVVATCQTLPSWPKQEVSIDSAPLAERLQIMFERYPELSSLHASPHFDNLTWLCQRWLELLPLPASEKQVLMAANSCSNTAEYLLSLMKDPH
ncbi:LON peptidase substrate-binding domain-containing protein [Enterovibrio coralii]|uniref:Lon protease n=1 Tax=Enterovibrio coralii TaxID=294935 RepID=A0A135I9J6_9GAMM|nr:LON peptidase substrate-binding domain-containing protein [Enterovibrio coralii]KXF82125.1 Lon protease [Enterovibrio coralii]